MGSAMGPDAGRSARDVGRHDTRDPINPADNHEYDDTVDDRFYKDSVARPARTEDSGDVDATGGYVEDPGYVDALLAGDSGAVIREAVVAREEDRFGGIKIGSAFFGWVAATGMAVLLAALAAVTGMATGLLTGTDVNAAAGQTASQAVGTEGMTVILVILFISYYSGGYVAGRMARFNGVGQGLMVWLWTLIVAAVVAVLGMTAGWLLNVTATVNAFLRIPLNEWQLSSSGIIAAIIAAAVALFGAVLGGTAGIRYHRKVDRAGFSPTANHYQP